MSLSSSGCGGCSLTSYWIGSGHGARTGRPYEHRQPSELERTEADVSRARGRSCRRAYAQPDAGRRWPLPPTHPDGEGTRVFVKVDEVAVRIAAEAQDRLRAAMSLACLWQQQGKRAEAYGLLAPVYGWFTEGFGTADLQEAKTLLEELA